MMDSKPVLLLAGLAGLLYLFSKTSVSTPAIAETFTPQVLTPALQAVKEFQETFKIVDTGEVTPMGSHVLIDNTTGGMVLRTGIVDIVGGLAPKVYGCEQRGGYYSFSNGVCYADLPSYCAKYSGADICR